MGLRNRKGLRRIDLTTFSIYLGLVTIGWLMIFSVGYHQETGVGFFSSSAGKQAIWIGISLFVFMLISLVDWKFWRTFAYPIYAVSIALLAAVLLLGVTIKGATSWFVFGGFSFQPSELAKFGTCLAMAGFLSTYNTDLRNPRSQFFAFTLFLTPMLLVLLQPDAGSALVFFSFLLLLYREGLPPAYYLIGAYVVVVFLGGLFLGPEIMGLLLLFVCTFIVAANMNGQKQWYMAGALGLAGLGTYLVYQGYILPVLIGSGAAFLTASAYYYQKKRSRLIGLLYIVVLSGGLLSYFSNHVFYEVMQPHQQDRINVWLRPGKCDPKGPLYNVLQSKMTISSGGLDGKGFLNGTMTKLNYVPEQSTDFIFCTIGEEQGFIGTLGIVALFSLLLYRITVIAERQRSNFSRHYAYGVAGIIFMHFFINIGMTMGLTPIIGIPLPFLSKGGSSLLGFTVMLAVLLKLDRHRFQI